MIFFLIFICNSKGGRRTTTTTPYVTTRTHKRGLAYLYIELV